MMSQTKEIKLVVISIIALMVFNMPLINIPNGSFFNDGMPSLYVYVFVVWITIIVVTALTVEQPNQKDE